MLERLKLGLKRTKDSLKQKIEQVIHRSVAIDENFYENLEEALLLADVGATTAASIIEKVRERYRQDKPADNDAMITLVCNVLEDILTGGAAQNPPFIQGLNVIMVMGVNGTGKTTSIGKLVRYYKDAGHNVMIAACDTFRAAAVDQLEIWADRAGVPIIRQREGTDPSAVMYDAVQAARARGVDILIVDTAGRLHTQVNLMRELQKIRRVAFEKANVESLRSWLVLDSTIGQNSLNQVKLFNDAVPVDGLILTKLDGTARGGIVFSIVNEMKIPIVFVGVGEQAEDLMPFDPSEFARALLGDSLKSESEAPN
jgi:fused signal recognition particle receptor